MSKNFLILILLILVNVNIYASEDIYINEISFLKPEFIELNSVNTLNLSKTLFYDSVGINKSNVLKLISNKNSNIYLIIGDDFLDNYNLSQLNATIYTTQKSGLGYYGLKDTGENFTIIINSTLNLSWSSNQKYEFNFNQTLNYNSSSKDYFITNSSPGSLTYNLSLLVNSTLNISNETINNISQNISNCNISFKIVPYKNLTFDKIEFQFKTNISVFQIEYWIETYLGEIIKSKRNTSNLNKKSYTPKSQTELFKIKAKLYFSNCILNDTKIVTYYNKNPLITNFENSPSSSSSKNDKVLISKSYILILNELDILNGISNILKYEVYKGNTAKRTIYFYLNKEKIHSFELGKYSEVKGQIKLGELKKNNTLQIKGLDLEKNILFFRKNSQNSSFVNKLLSNSLKLEILNINNSKIYFNLSHINQNLSIQCYINNVRTKISKILNINSNKTKIYSLELNISKLKKIKKSIFNLKLYCKYKKSGLKTYNYISSNFTYKLDQTKKNSKSKLNTSIFDTYNLNSIQYMSIQKDIKPSIVSDIKIEKNPIIYTSDNSKTKKTSIFYIFLALSFIVIVFVILW